jgi:hypothetical protein
MTGLIIDTSKVIEFIERRYENTFGFSLDPTNNGKTWKSFGNSQY